tara:strand:- start:4670 stop:4843 length:174 start_codon:yes stop_codon:yes gene_type:complete
MLSKYNKTIYPVVTFAASMLVVYGIVPEGAMTEELKIAVVGILTSLVNLISPANKPA